METDVDLVLFRTRRAAGQERIRTPAAGSLAKDSADAGNMGKPRGRAWEPATALGVMTGLERRRQNYWVLTPGPNPYNAHNVYYGNSDMCLERHAAVRSAFGLDITCSAPLHLVAGILFHTVTSKSLNILYLIVI